MTSNIVNHAVSQSSRRAPTASQTLAVVGATALVLGLIFVIAFNWAGLGKFSKFALVQGLLIALTTAAVFRGLNTTVGKGFLVMALGCIGPLLAVFGQTYQTGADVWQLFVGWAGLGLVWAIAARSGVGWLVWVVIAQTALWLHLDAYYDLSQFSIGKVPLWLVVLAVNGALLIIWEFAASKLLWLSGRSAPRLIAALLLFAMTSAAIHSIFWDRATTQLHPFLGWAVLMGAGFFWYAQGRRDIVAVTMGWVALAAVALAVVIKVLLKVDPIFTVFICFFIALGLLALGIRWLRKNFAGTNHWIVDLAAAFGAWISMLLLVLFIGLTVGIALVDSPPFWFVMSVLAALAAIGLSRTSSREQVFRNQLINVLALAAPTLGYIGIAVTRGGHYQQKAMYGVYLASTIALALWFFLSSKQARSLMALVVVYGVIAVLHHLGLGTLAVWLLLAIACAIWLIAPNSFLKDQAAIEAAASNVKIQRLTDFGYALSLWALVIGAGFRSHDRWGLWYAFWASRNRDSVAPDWTQLPWLPAVFAMLIAVVTAFILAEKLQLARTFASMTVAPKAGEPSLSASATLESGAAAWFSDPLILTLGLSAAAMSAWYTPYLLVCATFFAIGLATERLKLTALASFGLVAALFEYYFELASPLWMKGTVLAILGVLLLALALRGSRFESPTLAASVGAQS
jgi:uncharacterized membrane protein